MIFVFDTWSKPILCDFTTYKWDRPKETHPFKGFIHVSFFYYLNEYKKCLEIKIKE